jgi:pilus assembly protein CpaC
VRAGGGNDHLESIRRVLSRELPGQELRVSGENGTVFLSGTVSDLNSSARAVQIASVAGKVVNLLKVQAPGPERQVLLKVIFASVDRNKSKEVGLNIFSTGFGNVIGSVSTGQFTPPNLDPSGTPSLSSELNMFAFLPGLNLGATLQALETKGLVEILSEPNVLAENGRQGSILAGGEYPYPVVQGTSGGTSVSIQFKEYGVRLNFIPTIMPGGTIRLQVAPEVSALDFTNAVQVSGFNVPAISVRRVKTEIELTRGQSFAIGGLLDNRETETLSKTPFISNIPFLGKMFQSISRDKQNTELIVIVTPEIVDPIPAGAPLPTPKFPGEVPAAQLQHPHAYARISRRVALQPAPTAIPVETLIDSMKPEARFGHRQRIQRRWRRRGQRWWRRR